MINVDQPMVARRTVRLAAVAALQAANTAQSYGAFIESPGVLATPPDKFPSIKVRTTRMAKASKARGVPQFDTVVMLEVEGKISATTEQSAQDQLEALEYFTESALFYNGALVELLQQFTTVDSNSEITHDGRVYFGGFHATFTCELFEVFDPLTDPPPATAFPVQYPPAVPLQSIDLHIDTARPFDGSGTYTGSPFPASIQPAPRTSGPDGRDEGGLDIPLS